MEETVEAAAIVIKYLGASILEAKCGDLVAKARFAEQAAAIAHVNSADLSKAAQELEEAGEEGRLLAVTNLRAAAVAMVGSLEGAARDQLHALRGAAANLARSCGEYRDTAEAMDKILRAKEEEADVRASGLWWPTVWSRRLRHQGPVADVESVVVRPEQTADGADIAVTVNVLSQGMPQLEAAGHKILALARDIIAAAVGARVPHDQMLLAADALEQSGDPAARLNGVVNLGAAATGMEAADSAPLKAVRDRAVALSRSCWELEHAAKAIVRVERTAAKIKERRVAATRWPRLWGRRRRLSEQRGKSSRRRHSSLTLVRVTTKGQTWPRWRCSVRWACSRTWGRRLLRRSAYARSLMELRIAQIICRLGILGVNCFVIGFVYLSLGIQSKIALSLLLLLALAVHTLSSWLVCRRGDLSR